MSIPVSVLENISCDYQLQGAVLFAWDKENGHVVTYGNDADLSAQAADVGNKMKMLLGWPQSLQSDTKIVTQLMARVAELEEQIEESKKPKPCTCPKCMGVPDPYADDGKDKP